MAQVLSYIWRWLCPKPQSETRLTHQDDQLSQLINPLQQQSHCIADIAVDLSNVDQKDEETSGDKEIRVVENSLHKEKEMVCKVNDELKAIVPEVPSPNPDIVASTPTGWSPPQVPWVVVVLSNKDQITFARKNEDEHNHSYKEEVLAKKEIISKAPCESKKITIKRIGPYTSEQTILLVGEGDFSFSACLARAFGNAWNITATSLNSEEFLIDNYSKYWTNMMAVVTRGGNVIHGIDARTMAKDPAINIPMLDFDRIIFNFPHTGRFGRTDSDLRKHKKLVRGFFRNAKKMINGDGEIHVTNKTSRFFLQWDIPKIGRDHGLILLEEVKFKRRKYPGYHTKYGSGGDKDFDCNPSKTYKFGLDL